MKNNSPVTPHRLRVTPTTTHPQSEPRRRTDSSIGLVKEENNNAVPASVDDGRRPQFLTPQAPVSKSTREFFSPSTAKGRAKSIGSPRSSPHDSPRPTPRKKKFSQQTPNEAILVGLRIRPFLPVEAEIGQSSPHVFLSTDSTSVAINGAGSYERKELTYEFAKVFNDSEGSVADPQRRLYEELARPQLDAFLQGYNCAVLTYGQTGSGKTFSMFGNEEAPGIVPRFSDSLFSAIGQKFEDNSARLEVAYFEIYQEQVHDLLDLQKNKKSPSLKVREHPDTGPYVEGLIYRVVKNHLDLRKWMEHGMLRRATATTGMNDESSRSHAIFQLRLTQMDSMLLDGKDRHFTKVSQASLVDLAGSERSVTAQEGTTGSAQKKERYRETVSINKSLHTLKRVITVLSGGGGEEARTPRRSGLFVPFRDSSLTWLLKESIGGNSKTSLLVTVSPVWSQREETISSLRFGSQASSVVTRALVNEDQTSAILRRMKELEEENTRLREQAGATEETLKWKEDGEMELQKLRVDLVEQSHQMERLSRSFELRMRESEDARAELEHWSLFPVSSVPRERECLVETYQDPMMTSSVCLLRSPTTSIGAGEESDIWREGLRDPVHCWIEKGRGESSSWYLKPVSGGVVFLNGDRIEETTKLDHLDHLCLDGERFFLCWIPKGMRTSQGIKLELAKHSYSVMRLELLEKLWPKLKEASGEEVRRNRKLLEMELEDQLNAQREAQKDVEERLRRTEESEAELRRTLRSVQDNSHRTQQLQEELGELRQRQDVLLREKTTVMESESVAGDFKSVLLDELRKRTAEIEGTMDTPQRESMAALLFQVQRANDILQLLRKDFMTFEWSEEVGGEVRLRNSKQGISTLISREAFLERLDVLKSVHAGERKEEALEAIIFNRGDDWEKTAGRASDLYSAAMVNALKETARKRGTKEETVRKSLLIYSPKDRRSTLSSILESSVTEGECGDSGKEGMDRFWGSVSGILEGMTSETDGLFRLKSVESVELGMREVGYCRTLIGELESAQSSTDSRGFHAVQTGVSKLLVHSGRLNEVMVQLALSPLPTPTAALSNFAIAQLEAQRGQVRLELRGVNCGLMEWAQNVWRGMDEWSEKSAGGLKDALDGLVRVLGWWAFLGNHSFTLYSGFDIHNRCWQIFCEGMIQALRCAVEYLKEEGKRPELEPWVEVFLGSCIDQLFDVLDWTEHVHKKGMTGALFVQTAMLDLIMPLTHGILVLSDGSKAKELRPDHLSGRLGYAMERIELERESLDTFCMIRDEKVEKTPSAWLTEKVETLSRTLNSVMSEASVGDVSSSLHRVRRLIASPGRRRTSLWVQDLLSQVDLTGYSDDTVDI